MKNKFYRSNIPPRSALNLKIKNLNENANNTYKEKILRMIIYIYYYEKDKNEILNNKEKDFYLINYGWICEFKKIVLYEDICKLFSDLIKEINYNNLEKFMKPLLNHFIKEKKVVIKEKSEFKQLTNINYFFPEQIENEEIASSPFYYIIPSEIMDEIKESIFEIKNLDLSPIKIFFMNNNIFIKNKNIINVGALDNAFKFTIKYIFIFNSKEISNTEFKSLENIDIENYIKNRGCKLIINSVQIMKQNIFSSIDIGKLSIIKNTEPKKEKKNMNEINFSSRYKKSSENQKPKKDYRTSQNSPIKNNKVPKIKNISSNRIITDNIKMDERNNNPRNTSNLSQTYDINNIGKKENPKIESEKNLTKENKDEDKFMLLEKKMEKKYKDLSKIIEEKFNNMNKFFEEKYKIINNNFNEVIKYNKQLDDKFDNLKKENLKKLEENQNQINQLNEHYNIFNLNNILYNKLLNIIILNYFL